MNGQDREPTDSNGSDTAPSQAPLIRWPIYRGWWIVLAGLVALAVVEFADRTVPSRLFSPVNTDTVLFVGIAGWAFFGLTLHPVVGHLVDRHGPRVVITPALLFGGLVFISLSWAEPGWLPYVAAILFGSGLAAIVHIGMATAVANWFEGNRGKALALLLMGPAVALFLPALSSSLWIDLVSLADDASEALSGGYLSTFLELAAGIAVIASAVPLTILLRRKPNGSMARVEQGESPESDADAETAGQPVRAILNSRQYRLYVVALSFQMSAIGAIRIAAGPALGDSITSIGTRWFGDAVLASAVVVAVGLFVTGALSDRYNRRKVVTGILGAQMVCSLALVIVTDEFAVLALAVAIGGGAGALSAANLALQAALWGRRHFGLLLGIQMSAATLLTIVWVITTGFIWEILTRPPLELEDTATIYPFVIVGATLPLAIALIVILLMKRPQPTVIEPEPLAGESVETPA